MRKTNTSGGAFRKFLNNQLKDEEIRIVYEEGKARTRLACEMAKMRKLRGMTQTELAEKAGTTQTVISRMESGNDTRMPSLSLLSKLAAAMDLEMILCFERRDKDSSGNFFQKQ